jgi:hypothetical protein
VASLVSGSVGSGGASPRSKESGGASTSPGRGSITPPVDTGGRSELGDGGLRLRGARLGLMTGVKLADVVGLLVSGGGADLLVGEGDNMAEGEGEGEGKGELVAVLGELGIGVKPGAPAEGP